MKASIKNNILTIEVPLGTPRLSSTGKTYLLASENGKNIVKHEGKDISVQVNATYKP